MNLFNVCLLLLVSIVTLQGTMANHSITMANHSITRRHCHEGHHGPEHVECGVSSGHKVTLSSSGAEITTYPWFALLEFGSGEIPCAGVIIDSKHVLTSAYCVSKNPLTVKYGEWDPACTADSRLHSCANLKEGNIVSNVIVTESYTPEIKQDNIALLRLEKRIDFNEHVRPICIANDDFQNVTQLFYPQWNLQLKDLVSDTLIKRNDVQEIDEKTISVNPGCVLPGGPLVHVVIDETTGKTQSFVIGVNSGTVSVCHSGLESDVYTKVSDYTDFIKNRWRHH